MKFNIIGSGGCVNVLIDTPEDIAYAINNADIKSVDFIFYSHIDPDHTMGMRVVEQLRLDWLAYSIGKKCETPITVGTLPQILQDLTCQGTKYGSVRTNKIDQDRFLKVN